MERLTAWDFHSPADWTLYNRYVTANMTSLAVSVSIDYTATAGLDGYFDEVSFKQVLTPSTTGVTIVSAYGGSTYNWTSEESGFNRNDASGYTYDIEAGSPSISPSYQPHKVLLLRLLLLVLPVQLHLRLRVPRHLSANLSLPLLPRLVSWYICNSKPLCEYQQKYI